LEKQVFLIQRATQSQVTSTTQNEQTALPLSKWGKAEEEKRTEKSLLPRVIPSRGTSEAIESTAVRIERRTGTLLILTAVAVLTCILVFLEQPDHNLFWVAVWNCGHAPIFGVFALLVLAVGSAAIPAPGERRRYLYLAVFLISITVGLLTEIVQFIAGGDAELEDLGRDIAGAAAFLGFAASYDGQLRFLRSPHRRKAFRAGSLVLLAATLLPVMLLARVYQARNAAHPTVLDFKASWALRLLELRDADLKLNPSASGGRLARVTFRTGVFPGLTLQEPYPDWTQYKRLSFTVFSQVADPVRIVLRIDDIHHNNDHTDRFNRSLEIHPGINPISVLLSDIRQSPRTREMDMKHIHRLLLFAYRPAKPFSLDFDSLRLE
jgi:hypothetical protein